MYLSPRDDCVAQSLNHFYKPGYCVTDEPGFYKEGEFGMRIENAIYVVEAETKFNLPAGTQFYKVKYLSFSASKISIKYNEIFELILTLVRIPVLCV